MMVANSNSGDGVGGSLLAWGYGLDDEKAHNTDASSISGVIGIQKVGGACSDEGAQGVVDTGKMVEEFYKVFESLCENNGKTPAQVEAEKKAAEEKKAQETEAYKTLYNMDMKKTAKDAGVDPDKNIEVINAQSAADIKIKAEQQILNPLKAKIKAQMQGKGIPDSDLETMLNNAATAALSDCTEYSSTSDNYKYTINTSKLIDKFSENVKTIIKNKGYLF
jgi:hypothetical protein